MAREIDEQSRRHKNVTLYFVDNILREKGASEFAQAIAKQNRDYDIFYEMRASVRPYDMLLMWEAGLRETQFGIEGLSTSLLRRIGKGTTVIQNLQAMRLCSELRVVHMANLIVDFPGSTPEEVEETRTNLTEYALSFHPLNMVRFQLGVGSTVDTLRETFGVVRVRNKDLYKIGLPEDVWNRLLLFDLDFDLERQGADWTPVWESSEAWRRLHARKASPLLFYQDGGSFLNIIDERGEARLEGTFEALARSVYLYCTEIRSLARICQKFQKAETEILEVLERFIADRLMVSEQGKYLSLAIAPTPMAAARRIRAAHAEERSEPSTRLQSLIVA